MSGTYPSTPVYRVASLTSISPTMASYTQSGNRQVRSIPGHNWSIRASYQPLTRAELMPLYAFALKQKGKYETFTIVPPELATPQGVATGTPLVNGASQTGNTLIIDGATISTTGWMKAGDPFKLAGHSKVYMVVEDADSDGSGNVTLTIEPALFESPANNEALTVTNVPFTVSFVDDSQIYNVEPGTNFGFSVDMVEAY